MCGKDGILLRLDNTRNRKRLLHPGADTKDILTQYVSMIRCLRILDPPGVLLYKVADPVRRYLRYAHIRFETEQANPNSKV